MVKKELINTQTNSYTFVTVYLTVDFNGFKENNALISISVYRGEAPSLSVKSKPKGPTLCKIHFTNVSKNNMSLYPVSEFPGNEKR